MPDLPLKLVTAAFKNLDQSDVVFGPSEDGGYYLIGLINICKELFENILWSSDRVLNQSFTQTKFSNLTWSLLPEKYDIDTKDDLIKLYHDLKHKKDQIENFPLNTWKFLEDFFTEK